MNTTSRGIFMRVSCVVALWCAAAAAAAKPTPAEVFERRLVPIFRSPRPSSCVQCHLAGVDLKAYILPDAARTFRSLRDQGLIDLDAPEKSKIVRLIDKGEANPIHAATRRAERAAFVEWIRACAADPALRAAPPAEDRAGPQRPAEVVRHARRDRMAESFERDVWAWRFRCMNCHTEGTPQNDKLRAEHGERVAWVKRAGAAATMDYLLASKLANPADPERSLLLRKPLGEKHGGGVKFAPGDQAYKGFRAWLEDVARIRRDEYRTAADLPPVDAGPRRVGTDVWLKLTDCPPDWAGKLVQVRVYAWDAARAAWGDTPIATSDRVVGPGQRVWQHNLTLLGADDLPAGRYRVVALVDRAGRLARDWRAELGDADVAGRAEVQARWRPGYAAMTAVQVVPARP